MKKAIFAAAAIFFGFVFLSCSDVFGGRETDGIAFTVPPLAPQSASSPARAAAGGAEGPWSIYGFLFGEDADPVKIKNIGNGQFTPPSAGEAQGYKGLIQAVSRKGVDISRPQPLFFQRVQAKTKCFVCVLVTYTTSAKTEYTVFSGISPDSVVKYDSALTPPYFFGDFYTPDTGENDISLTLKRNESAPVYFATQNGVGVINSYGQSTYSPQQSTPYKPTHFYWSHGGDRTGALRAVQDLPPDEAGVIILMDDVDVSGTLLSISTSGNGVDHSVDFASISGKRCKLKAKDFSVSSGRYLSFTDVRIEGTVSPTSRALVDVRTGGELRLGGAVTLEDETKIQLGAERSSPGQNGKIVIVRPLVDDVGKVIVEYRDSSPTEAEIKEHAKADMQTYPILRDDTGANTQVPDFFDDEVEIVCTPSLSFTGRWKRMSGNWWGLADD